MPPTRVLFVCMGNICRSPAAEIIFRKLIQDHHLDGQFEIDSAGTTGYHAGAAPDARMSETLRRRGYEISGKSRKIKVSDLTAFDHILVMDETNLSDVRGLDPRGFHHPKIKPMKEFARSHDVPRIPDPYYGGIDGFEHVADLLEDACAGLLERLME